MYAALNVYGGYGLPRPFANYVVANPQLVSAFVTFVGTVDRIISAFFFKKVIDRFSEEWVRSRGGRTSVFNLSTLLAFRHKSFMWEFSEIKRWKEKRRRVWVALLVVCTTGFALMPTGVVALITPGPFTVQKEMIGDEIDIGMRSSPCARWWSEASFSPSGANCTSKPSASNNTGCQWNVLHFLGPGRGVLPMGPNGSPASNISSLSMDAFSNATDLMRSYVYNLTQQGFNANTVCEYETTSLITFTEAEAGGLDVMEYRGSCDSASGWLDLYPSPGGVPKGWYKTLASWVCESSQDHPAAKRYKIHLSLKIGEDDPLFSASNSGFINIGCTTAPLTFGLYEVTFNSSRNQFEVSRDPLPAPPASDSNSTGIFDASFRDVILSNTNAFIPLMQNSVSNMLVESVVASGVKIFQSPAGAHGEDHLKLYAAMLNGIMEYTGTAIRAQLSSASIALPTECRQIVRGYVSYQVIGWNAKPSAVYFLIPLTLANTVTLCILLYAAGKAWGKEKCGTDPTDVRSVLAAHTRRGMATANGRRADNKPDWADEVTFA
ncbi:hypothetical protein MD484_g5039, partial [Candolleomyces efflorescens]